MPQSDLTKSKGDARTALASLSPDRAGTFLADSLTGDARNGVLRLLDVPCVILRPEAIVNIQRQLESTIGGSSKGILYLSGERSARTGMNPIDALVTTEGPLTLANARRITDGAALLGWGRLDISMFDPPHGRLLLTLAHSPLAQAYGTSKKPVCHFLAGWIAGIGRTLLERDVLCEETGCAAQGRARCEFELHTLTLP